MTRKVVLYLWLMLLLPGAALAADVAADAAVDAGSNAHWELVSSNDGVLVYMAHLPNDRLKTFRGVTTMKLDDFGAIAAFMDDYAFVASWMHMVSSITGIARTSPTDRLVYVTTWLPWPVSNRDAVLHVSMEQDPNTYAVRMPFHNVDNILSPRDGYVRMPQMQGYYLFRPLAPGEVEVTLQVIVDPGGYIPGWMANLIMHDIPYYSLLHLRVLGNEPRFRNKHLDYYKIPPSWLAAAKPQPAAH